MSRDDDTGSGAPAEGSASAMPRLNALFRLQWEPAQNAWVLLYPEGMVKLNHSAAAILQRCDGARTLPMLIAELQSAFAGAPDIASEVHRFVEHARTRGWLV